MGIHNYKKVSHIAVQEWLYKSIPELTQYQRQEIYNREIARFAPFAFFEKKKKVNSIWWRLSIIGLPIVWVLLFAFMPINFIFTGMWGYSHKKIKWWNTWAHNTGIY